MFLVYTDASGTLSPTDKENFVLASLITHETNWQIIDNEVREIKTKHFPDLPDSSIEIHAKDMLNQSGIFKGLSWDKIYEILDDVFDLILRQDIDLTIIAVIIDKQKLHQDKDGLTWAYRLMYERLNRFIERQNIKIGEAQACREYGLVVMDSEDEKKNKKLRLRIRQMLKEGTMYSKLECLIEDPLFTDSKWGNLLQLADCVAYCVRKHYRVGNKPSFHTEKWEQYFRKIEPKFDGYQKGNYLGYGVKIFP